MRWSNGKQYGVLRHAIDLLARNGGIREEKSNNSHIEVMLQTLITNGMM